MTAVAVFYYTLSSASAQPEPAKPTAGNISFVSADLEQWQSLGSSHTSSVTFRRDDTGAGMISGNFTFSLPEDEYTTRNVSFVNWTRGSDLTIDFDYTVPADGYAGALSPAFRLDLDLNQTLSYDYLNETGRYIFVTFSVADPEPEKDNLGNDDLSTLVPPGYYDQRFESRKADAYNNSLNASMAMTNGVEPYVTRDLYGAMKNVTSYTSRQMTSDNMRWQYDPYYGELTQSDWYIGYNQSGFGPRYHGICKDYASLARSYYRSMGIPAKLVICIMQENGTAKSHAWVEAYDGSRWVHADPSWNLFDDPQYYDRAGYTEIQIRELSICEKKPTSIRSSGVADDLIFQAWIYWDAEGKLDFDTVVDRGYDPMYS
jgi:transglutaminase-like putative cysteine protease